MMVEVRELDQDSQGDRTGEEKRASLGGDRLRSEVLQNGGDWAVSEEVTPGSDQPFEQPLRGTAQRWSQQSIVLKIKHSTYLTKNWVVEDILGMGGSEGNYNSGKGQS